MCVCKKSLQVDFQVSFPWQWYLFRWNDWSPENVAPRCMLTSAVLQILYNYVYSWQSVLWRRSSLSRQGAKYNVQTLDERGTNLCPTPRYIQLLCNNSCLVSESYKAVYASPDLHQSACDSLHIRRTQCDSSCALGCWWSLGQSSFLLSGNTFSTCWTGK